VNVDYSLLHHFRVSQRRELALRGGLPARFHHDDFGPDRDDLDEALRAHLIARPAGFGAVVQLVDEDR
jgi:hypothetical protein